MATAVLAREALRSPGERVSLIPLVAGAGVLHGFALAGASPSVLDSTLLADVLVVLGFDGVDPRLCERMMDAGELPNLAKMRDAGGFKPLGTTMPPQSPVAWASFITGANPGVHGIFDFIHRDPKRQCSPYYSAAETVPGDKAWAVGEHNIPLTFWPFNHNPTQTLLKRDGTTGQFSDIGTAVEVSGDQIIFRDVDVDLLGSNFTLGYLGRYMVYLPLVMRNR